MELQQDYEDQNILDNYKCIMPCTIKMLNQIHNQIIPNFQGFKVDQVNLIGRIIKPLQFGNSPKGYAQVIMTVQDISYYDQIQIKITQYETQKDILEFLMRKNNLSSITDFQNQCFKFIITIKQLQKKKLIYEAKNLERIQDYNKITLHFSQIIRSYCDRQTYNKLLFSCRQFGSLQGEVKYDEDTNLNVNKEKGESDENQLDDIENYLY